MCGIVFIHRLDDRPADRGIMVNYRAQKARGSQGFGYVVAKKGRMEKWIKSETETVIDDALLKENGGTIMFHHRYPTSTPNYREAAHPIKVSNDILTYDYYVVHNGVITNDEALKEEHNKLGFAYSTEITQTYTTRERNLVETCFNDSESLAIELALFLEGLKKDIGARGSIAFMCMQVDKKTQQVAYIYYGRNNSNPLKRLDEVDQISIRSEGAGTLIEPNKLFCIDPRTSETTVADVKVGESYYQYDKAKTDDARATGHKPSDSKTYQSRYGYWDGVKWVQGTEHRTITTYGPEDDDYDPTPRNLPTGEQSSMGYVDTNEDPAHEQESVEKGTEETQEEDEEGDEESTFIYDSKAILAGLAEEMAILEDAINEALFAKDYSKVTELQLKYTTIESSFDTVQEQYFEELANLDAESEHERTHQDYSYETPKRGTAASIPKSE